MRITERRLREVIRGVIREIHDTPLGQFKSKETTARTEITVTRSDISDKLCEVVNKELKILDLQLTPGVNFCSNEKLTSIVSTVEFHDLNDFYRDPSSYRGFGDEDVEVKLHILPSQMRPDPTKTNLDERLMIKVISENKDLVKDFHIRCEYNAKAGRWESWAYAGSY